MARIASAVVLIAVLLGTVWLLPWWATVLLGALAAAQGGMEMAGLAGAAGTRVSGGFLAFTGAALTAAFALHAVPAGAPSGDALPAVLLATIVCAGALALAAGTPSPTAFTRAATLAMAPMYVGLPLGALVWVALAAGPAAFTGLLAVVAASDTAQFYAGRAFGRRKLAPAMSPAKTVEGAVGGLVAAAIAAAAFVPWWLPGVSRPAALVLGLALASFGMAGDLFESLLKRSAGVKDSSSMIPGHGGVLDRLDSHLFAAPCFYVFLRYIA
jgi:phosphatidate cytidylyltransferase